MEKIYITGHKKPDTDSVASAIVLANLKKQLGFNAEAYVLNSINYETQFVLDYFNIKKPKELDNVKLQIKDLEYILNLNIEKSNSILNTFKFMNLNNLSVIPITNNNKLLGIVSMKDIAKYFISNNSNCLKTNLLNLLEAINGEEVIIFNDKIEGNIFIASYQHKTFIDTVNINKNSIVVTGNRPAIIEHSINKSVNTIIITGNHTLSDELLFLAQEKKVNIIKTPFDTFTTAKYISFSNLIESITLKENIVIFNETDFVTDFIDTANKTKYSNYPIVDNKNNCLGLVKLSHISTAKKKKVILVDHNEIRQSVDGLDEAEIIEIIDHHNISSLGTSSPINYRVMPIACTCTILYKMYKENNVEIDKKTAGLMASAIISDTLMLKSPTTTQVDIDALNDLCQIAEINYESYGLKMLKAGSSLKGKSKEEIIFGDFKNFTVGDHKLGIGQTLTFNPEEIIVEKDEYIKVINDLAKTNDYKILAFFVTDILKNGSYLFYNESAKDIIEEAYEHEIYQGIYLSDFISRKKQMAPKLINELEQK